ncbi:MAG TPA: glycosyltransferase family 4 protein [Gaiellaceae bacterium]|nr:glycosyltransferase family 4 protein [Gaiellaceae bacterium]
MRVAYFSPLPPERSGIADYSALLLPALRERLDVVTVQRGAKRAPRGTDVALYHVGNNPDAHGWIVDALRRRPGIVVLHEFVLHHLVAGLTLGRGDREGYLDAMQREAGVEGRLLAHGVVDGLLPPLWEARPHEFPLAAEILDLADGAIVHSRYVARLVRELGYRKPVWRIPFPAGADPSPTPERPGDGRPLIGCLGYLNRSKRVPQLVAAFARVRRRFPDATLLLAGAVACDLDLDEELERAALGRDEGGVVVLGYVDERRFESLLAGCDVCVSLRSPTMGETSASAIRALALGRPLVVSDVGWFAELPDGVAAKIPVDEREVEVLAGILERLASDDSLRERMSARAREHVRDEHDLERVADEYLAALEEAAGGEPVRDAVYGEVARAAYEVGLDAADPELSEIAERAGEVRLGG